MAQYDVVIKLHTKGSFQDALGPAARVRATEANASRLRAAEARTRIRDVRRESSEQVQASKRVGEALGAASERARDARGRFVSMGAGAEEGSRRAEAAIKRMNSSAAGGWGGAIDAGMGGLARAGIGAGLIGGAAGIAAVTYGVAGLNEELETTKISLGTIYSARGISKDLPEGIKMASDSIAEMRKQAAKLPGEFQDLQDIMINTAMPAFGAGLDREQHLKFSAKLMAAGVVAKLPLDQVARESALLLEGRAGGQVALGVRLMGLSGDHAAEFNKLSAPERIERLSKELDKFGGSIDTFGESFTAQKSTLIDTAKESLRKATEPLFEATKRDMGGLMKWMDEHQASNSVAIREAGQFMLSVYERGKRFALEWGPEVFRFAKNTADVLGEAASTWKPVMEPLAAALKDALSDRATIERLIYAAQLWSAVKVARTGLSVLGGAAELAGGAASLGGKAGKAIHAAGGFGGAMSSLGALAANAGPAALAVAALGTAAWMVYDQVQEGNAKRLQRETSARQTELEYLQGRSVESAEAIWKDRLEERSRIQELIEAKRRELDATNSAVEQTRIANELMALEQSVAIANMRMFADELHASAGRIAQFGETTVEDIAGRAQGNQNLQGLMDGWNALKGNLRPMTEKKTDTKAHKGGGGTHIQKVEIVVTSNQEPGRLAEVIFDKMSHVRRNRRTSPFVKNYSAI